MRHRRSGRLDRAQGRRRADQASRHSRSQRNLARRCGKYDHAGARHRRLDHRSRSGQEDRGGRGPRKPAGLRSHVPGMLAFADPDLDNGPRTDRSATMRMCAVTRQVRPIDELIRFVVAPSGEVIPDLKRKLPGRGLWVAASRQTVAEAVRRHQFSKGFKREVRVSSTLSADTEALLVRSTIDALAMAAKAGQVVSGFGKVEDTIRSRQTRASVGALIHASDGAADGIRKLDAVLRQNA